MRRGFFYKGAALIGVLLIASGCVSNRRAKKDFNSLYAQTVRLQSEVARLDSSLRELQWAIEEKRSRVPQPESKLVPSGKMYRTPSGFEVPAVQIQKALKNAGYYQGKLDGKIGSKTRQAIQAFQRDHDLDADGVVGKGTWARLQAYVNRMK